MKLPPELDEAIKSYKKATPWHAQWPLVRPVIFLAIPLIIILLAIAAGVTVGDYIATHCANGTMPASLRWLCF
jgi:hypothetical protein